MSSPTVAARDIDPEFLDLPARPLAEAVLQRLRDLGCSHGDFRLERLSSQDLSLRDATVENLRTGLMIGYAVRVVHQGTYGFASGVELTVEAAVAVADTAVAVARVSAPINSEPVGWAAEPAHGDVRWVSAYEIDPFTVPDGEKIELLRARSASLLAAEGVDHVDAVALAVKENKFYADLAGTVTTQQRVRVQSFLTAVAIGRGATTGMESMRTLAAPAGRGWEYVASGVDWDGEISQLPHLLAEKCAAPSVEAGTYDLVIDPTNLFLTIHESIGHATELDRALGYEANYAGTSFATIDQLNTLRYGSPLLHVTGDRTVPHGLATIGYDDEGVAAQSWDLIRDGVLVGYQLDRRMALQQGFGRSNGCAFADSPGHVPVQRMANVSLVPQPGGPSTDELISGVDRGIYIVGDKSWSIDMQRYNFQFTGQRFYRIRDGRLDGQLRDVAYQATTTDFWGSLDGLGGPQTYVLGGAFNCGKAQPGQVAAVSHGSPSALFRQVRILNTTAEAGS